MGNAGTALKNRCYHPGRIEMPVMLLMLVLTRAPGDHALANESAHGKGFTRNNLGVFLGATDPSLLGFGIKVHPTGRENLDLSVQSA